MGSDFCISLAAFACLLCAHVVGSELLLSQTLLQATSAMGACFIASVTLCLVGRQASEALQREAKDQAAAAEAGATALQVLPEYPASSRPSPLPPRVPFLGLMSTSQTPPLYCFDFTLCCPISHIYSFTQVDKHATKCITLSMIASTSYLFDKVCTDNLSATSILAIMSAHAVQAPGPSAFSTALWFLLSPLAYSPD